MVRPPQYRLLNSKLTTNLPPSPPQSFQLFARIYQVMNSVVPDASGYRRCVSQLLPNIRLTTAHTRKSVNPAHGRIITHLSRRARGESWAKGTGEKRATEETG